MAAQVKLSADAQGMGYSLQNMDLISQLMAEMAKALDALLQTIREATKGFADAEQQIQNKEANQTELRSWGQMGSAMGQTVGEAGSAIHEGARAKTADKAKLDNNSTNAQKWDELFEKPNQGKLVAKTPSLNGTELESMDDITKRKAQIKAQQDKFKTSPEEVQNFRNQIEYTTDPAKASPDLKAKIEAAARMEDQSIMDGLRKTSGKKVKSTQSAAEKYDNQTEKTSRRASTMGQIAGNMVQSQVDKWGTAAQQFQEAVIKAIDKMTEFAKSQGESTQRQFSDTISNYYQMLQQINNMRSEIAQSNRS